MWIYPFSCTYPTVFLSTIRVGVFSLHIVRTNLTFCSFLSSNCTEWVSWVLNRGPSAYNPNALITARPIKPAHCTSLALTGISFVLSSWTISLSLSILRSQAIAVQQSEVTADTTGDRAERHKDWLCREVFVHHVEFRRTHPLVKKQNKTKPQSLAYN